jgi:hypothetical protein
MDQYHCVERAGIELYDQVHADAVRRLRATAAAGGDFIVLLAVPGEDDYIFDCVTALPGDPRERGLMLLRFVEIFSGLIAAAVPAADGEE